MVAAVPASGRWVRLVLSCVELGALRTEAVALLRELIRVDTSNPPGNETAAAELLRDYLVGHGIACEFVARVAAART